MPNQAALDAAGTVVDRVIKDFVSLSQRAIVLKAPAGAGKSGAVCRAAIEAARLGHRVLVTGQTNSQVQDLVRRLVQTSADVPIAYCPASSVPTPDDFSVLPSVSVVDAAAAAHRQLVVATTHKVAFSPDSGDFDAAVIDEAYQCDSTLLYCIANRSECWLLVGDPGQLDPFSTADVSQWRGLAEDPTLTAVDVLLHNYPATPVHPFPISRRLSPSAVGLVSGSFYPDLSFEAATLEGERELRLGNGAGTTTGYEVMADAALDQAGTSGWAHVVLPARRSLSADQEVAETITATVARLLTRQAKARCERWPTQYLLTQPRIAVGVAHRDQRDLMQGLLQAEGLCDVRVDTANSLQGLEFDVTVVWHPLTGQFEADEFHLDPGRMCVLLSRHRHACIVVGRESDSELLRYQPAMQERWLGLHADPVTLGWEAHSAVLAAMSEHRVA